MFIIADDHRVIQQVARQVVLQPGFVGILTEIPPVGVERVTDISHTHVLASGGALGDLFNLFQHILRSPGGMGINQEFFTSIVVDKTRLVR